MNKKLLFTFSFIIFLPTLVLAQNLEQLLHIPSDYSTMPNLLYFVILPFLGTFAIIWGILTNINIFKNYRVNILLSLIFAFSLLYYGVLLAITHYLFAIGGIFGVVSFFVLFFGLSSLYAAKRIGEDYTKTKKIYDDYGKVQKNRKNISGKLKEIEDDIRKTSKKMDETRKIINVVEDTINLIQRETKSNGLMDSGPWKKTRDVVKRLTGSSSGMPYEARDYLIKKSGALEGDMKNYEKKVLKLQKERERYSDELKETL